MHTELPIQEKVNILLVDDHEENLIALEAILTSPEYNLVKCTSGKAALRELLKDDFALILLDVMMPEMDGFELATMIRQRERSRHTPLIFLTAVAKEVRYIYRGYRVGAVDYLQKPLEADIVAAKVTVFVDLFRKSLQIKRQAELLRQSELRDRRREISRLKVQSEKRYKFLADAIPQIVWTASSKGNPIYFNQQWNRYVAPNSIGTGRNGNTWEMHQSAFFPEDFEAFFKAWYQTSTDCDLFEFQCRLKKLDDSDFRWHLCRALPERDEEGKLSGWIGTWTDIHDQKRAEQQQRFLAEAGKVLASSLNYDVTLKNLGELTVPYIADWCLLDLTTVAENGGKYKVIHAQESNAEWGGKLEKHSLSMRTLIQDLGAGRTPFVETISKAQLREMVEDDELFSILDGLSFRSVMSIPLEVRGQTFGVMTFVSGESNRIYGESELRFACKFARHAALAVENARLYELSRDTNRLRDEFLATISHELRTPLGAVLGWSEILLEKQFDSDTTKCLETVYRNGKTLARLVEDLLDVSRIITGKLSLMTQRFLIGPVIEAAMDAVKPAAEAKGIQLTCQFEDGVGSIVGDPARIQQIAWNLVSNAIKFTPKGGHVRVELTTTDDGDIVFKVIDDGIGLRSDFIPHIFERFRQADGTMTRAAGGLGLGLAIVRHLVELHGGMVEASSAGTGKGSVFTITLPTNAHGIGDESQTTSAMVERHSEAHSVELSGLSVLVVDDQIDSRDFLSSAIGHRGAAVAKVGSVNEAVASLSKNLPDIVLSDIGMIDQNGVALLNHIRHFEGLNGNAHIPVAAISASKGEVNHENVIAAGFDALISKPFRIPELIQVIASLAHGSLSRRGVSGVT